MKHIKKMTAVILTVLLLCGAVSAPAEGFTNEGAIRFGTYTNGNFSCTIPNGFRIDRYNSSDRSVSFSGPADVNGFSNSIRISVQDRQYDLSSITESAEQSRVYDILGGYNMICVADINAAIGSVPCKKLAYLYDRSDDDRAAIYYAIYFNIGSKGVKIIYYGYTATRTVPNDLPEFESIVTNAVFR